MWHATNTNDICNDIQTIQLDQVRLQIRLRSKDSLFCCNSDMPRYFAVNLADDLPFLLFSLASHARSVL